VAIVAAISGVATYRVASAPKETIRLAVLPFQAAPPAPRLTEIQSQTARRIAALTGGPSKKFSVILPTDAVRRQVFTGAQARAVFSATHALQAAFRDDAGHLLIHARIIDAGSGGSAKEWHARYAPSELRYIPTALAGVVTGTFHLPVAANSPNVNARAKDDYLAGVEALRRDSGADVALTHMERAVAADPDSAVTHAGLAEARRMKYATANDRSWLGRVQESLREAERRNPDLPEVRLIAGWMLAEAGRYQQAVAEYLRCIELAPANGDAYRRLGMAYRGNDQPEQALAAHRRAIQVDSKYWRNFEALGNFHLRRGEYSEAVESLSGAVERAPAEPGARRLLAQAYSDLGRFSEAETELRTALALEESWDSLQTLSVVLLNQGQDREAIPFIMRAIELRPQSHLSWISLGMAHQRLGMRAKAEWANQRGLELAEKEMQKNARNGYVRSCLAYLCARLGNQTRADSEITQALQLAQKDSHVLWMAMLTYEALGRRDDAFAVLKEAPRGVLEDVSRSPDFADLRHDPRFQKLLLTLDQGK
jgi:Flp pilus assembly protein TadD